MNDKYPYLNEFIKALQDEIERLEQFGASQIRISNGELIKIESGEYVYSFIVEDLVAATDDQPVELSYLGKSYKAVFIGRVANTIKLSLVDNLGEKIDVATLIISPVFLLKALITVLEQLPNIESYNFNFPDEIIGKKHLSPPVTGNLDKTVDVSKIDEYKKAAIANSIGSKFSFIWGPPGTGKTTTIGKLVEHFLKVGKRVLITSHTNIAVDTALRDVLADEKDNVNEGVQQFYDEGKILRLGIHQLQALEKFPMVFGDNISKKHSADLLQELARLDAEIIKLINRNKEVEVSVNNIRLLEHILQKKTALETDKLKISDELKGLENILKEGGVKIILIKHQLEKAKSNSWFTNLVQGLNADKLLSRLDKEEQANKQISELIERDKDKLHSLKIELDEITADLRVKHYDDRVDSQSLVSELENNLQTIDNLRNKKRTIQEQIDQLSKLLVNSARVVATTLTKCYLRSEVLAQQFDVVIIDEISMAQIPQMFVSLGLGRQAILVGDFLQLPPITQANTEMSKKWLALNMFDYFNISKEFFRSGKMPDQMKPLFLQYRMHPDISGLVNEYVYKGKLKDSAGIRERREKSTDKAPFVGHVGFLNTNDVNAYTRKKEGRSRFTIKNAFIDLYIAYKTVIDYISDRNTDLDEKEDIVGVVTPYRAQANLLSKLLTDIEFESNGKKAKLAQYVEMNTVHKFQGNQRSVIIFDITDDFPMPRPAMFIDDEQEDGDDAKLVNVAVTRAQDKFLMVGNKSFVETKHSSSSLIKRVLSSIEKTNKSINYDVFTKTDKRTSFDISVIQTADDVTSCINEATSSILLTISDLFSTGLFRKIKSNLELLVKKGITVDLFTQLPNLYTKEYQMLASEIIKQLKRAGIRCNLRTKLRDTIIIIDGKQILCLIDEGNIKGVVVSSIKGAKELIRLLRLDDTSELMPCPECQKKGRNGVIVPKISRFGVFYSCSLYPKCKYIDKDRSKNAKSQNPLDKLCPECGKQLVRRKGKFGYFISCSGYPECHYKEKANRKSFMVDRQ